MLKFKCSDLYLSADWNFEDDILILRLLGGWHECYYGMHENSTSSLDYVEQCTGGEGLCVRVTNQRENYEYR